MTVTEAVYHISHALKNEYSPEQLTIIAHWIMEHITRMSSAELRAHNKMQFSDEQSKKLTAILHEHITLHKPLQYIFGTVPFLGLTLDIRPPILIPRPETEYWCHLLINMLKKLDNQKLDILDMCTGSGCIALALAAAFPQANVTAVDLSKQACALTQENACKNKISLTIIQSNLFNSLPPEKFDLIVSNPPYISETEYQSLDPSVKEWEDARALLAGSDGLAVLSPLILEAPEWLKKNDEMNRKKIPQLIVEIGDKQGKLVQDIFRQAGFDAIVHKDLAGLDRFVTGISHGKN